MKRSTVLILILFFSGCQSKKADLKTSSGRWQPQETGSSASLRSLCVVNKDIAWASGSGGTYLRTTDRGENWQNHIVPDCEDVDFRDVHAWSEDKAILLSAGRPAKVMKTDDGGLSWRQTYFNNSEGIFFNGMAFWDDNRGIAVGDPIGGKFTLIMTQNAGETWHELPKDGLPPALEGESNFAASGTCITVFGDQRVWFVTGGPKARLFYSQNRGKKWQVFETPLQHGKPSQGGFSVLFWNEQQGIIVGGDYQDEANPHKNVALTFNGGQSWSLMDQMLPAGFRECITPMSAKDRLRLIAVGPSGADISNDSGRTWVQIDTSRFHAAAFSPCGKSGWAVGAEGLIANWLQNE